mmetsp:Transcript_14874/g.40955  ORF Transcript_14874/g.40955 Transcript_14874/m.40955 type:complete len:500 (-) Transcript_14874:11-1510(-)
MLHDKHVEEGPRSPRSSVSNLQGESPGVIPRSPWKWLRGPPAHRSKRVSGEPAIHRSASEVSLRSPFPLEPGCHSFQLHEELEERLLGLFAGLHQQLAADRAERKSLTEAATARIEQRLVAMEKHQELFDRRLSETAMCARAHEDAVFPKDVATPLASVDRVDQLAASVSQHQVLTGVLRDNILQMQESLCEVKEAIGVVVTEGGFYLQNVSTTPHDKSDSVRHESGVLVEDLASQTTLLQERLDVLAPVFVGTAEALTALTVAVESRMQGVERIVSGLQHQFLNLSAQLRDAIAALPDFGSASLPESELALGACEHLATSGFDDVEGVHVKYLRDTPEDAVVCSFVEGEDCSLSALPSSLSTLAVAVLEGSPTSEEFAVASVENVGLGVEVVTADRRNEEECVGAEPVHQADEAFHTQKLLRPEKVDTTEEEEIQANRVGQDVGVDADAMWPAFARLQATFLRIQADLGQLDGNIQVGVSVSNNSGEAGTCVEHCSTE